MTDAERQAVNDRIATAMGWRQDQYARWRSPAGNRDRPPNFFTGPAAADALLRWLAKRGYWWRVLTLEEGFRARVGKGGIADLLKSGSALHPENWMESLALAADAAIGESNVEPR